MRENRQEWCVRLRGAFCLILLFIVVVTGCSAKAKTTSFGPKSEITGSEKEELLGDMNDRIYQISKRGDEQKEPAVMEAIYVGGKEVSVKEGRYRISGRQAGIITILDDHGEEWFREVLGTSTNEVTVSLLDSDVIHADAGFEYVSVKAVEAEPDDNYLTIGMWEVGKDIDPGTYRMTSDMGHGFVEIYDEGNDPRIYEVTSDFRMMNSELQSVSSEKEREEKIKEMEKKEASIYKETTLRKGEIIRITDIGHVKFEKISG